jgi:hypothetical protein
MSTPICAFNSEVPKSNSWLPNAEALKPMIFMIAISTRPTEARKPEVVPPK